MTRGIVLAVVLAACVAAGPARAHGELTPRHGGLVAWAGEVGLELVLGADRTELHLDDHGEPMPSAGMTALVETSSGDRRASTLLVPSESSRLAGPPLRHSAGDRIVVLLTLADGRVLRGRIAAR